MSRRKEIKVCEGHTNNDSEKTVCKCHGGSKDLVLEELMRGRSSPSGGPNKGCNGATVSPVSKHEYDTTGGQTGDGPLGKRNVNLGISKCWKPATSQRVLFEELYNRDFVIHILNS